MRRSLKGGVCCVAASCKSVNVDKEVSFHAFPKDATRRKQWTDFVRAKRKWTGPSDFSRLCSKHFTRECFSFESLFKIEQMGFSAKDARITLKKDAVPTIHADAGSLTKDTAPEGRKLDMLSFSQNSVFQKDPPKKIRRAYAKREVNRLISAYDEEKALEKDKHHNLATKNLFKNGDNELSVSKENGAGLTYHHLTHTENINEFPPARKLPFILLIDNATNRIGSPCYSTPIKVNCEIDTPLTKSHEHTSLTKSAFSVHKPENGNKSHNVCHPDSSCSDYNSRYLNCLMVDHTYCLPRVLNLDNCLVKSSEKHGTCNDTDTLRQVPSVLTDTRVCDSVDGHQANLSNETEHSSNSDLFIQCYDPLDVKFEVDSNETTGEIYTEDFFTDEYGLHKAEQSITKLAQIEETIDDSLDLGLNVTVVDVQSNFTGVLNEEITLKGKNKFKANKSIRCKKSNQVNNITDPVLNKCGDTDTNGTLESEQLRYLVQPDIRTGKTNSVDDNMRHEQMNINDVSLQSNEERTSIFVVELDKNIQPGQSHNTVIEATVAQEDPLDLVMTCDNDPLINCSISEDNETAQNTSVVASSWLDNVVRDGTYVDLTETNRVAEEPLYSLMPLVKNTLTSQFDYLCAAVEDLFVIKSKSNGFTIIKTEKKLKILQLYETNIPSVKIVVEINKEFLCSIYVHRMRLDGEHVIWKDLPTKLKDVYYVGRLLFRIMKSSVCAGNFEHIYQNLPQLDSYLQIDDHTEGYIEGDFGAVTVNGHEYSSTIRSTKCNLLITNSVKCKHCITLGNNLKSKILNTAGTENRQKRLSQSTEKIEEKTYSNLLEKIQKRKEEFEMVQAKAESLES